MAVQKTNIRTTILVISAIFIICFILYLVFRKKKETFIPSSDPSSPKTILDDGNYTVQNLSGKKLMSSAVTLVMCDDFKIVNSSSSPVSSGDGWRLRRVTDQTYMLFKPTDEECLYASDGGQLRSYSSSCPRQNLCGSDKLNYKGELDNQNDYRTYFRLVDADGGLYIISNHNNKYVCIDDKSVKFVDSPDKNCIFKFNKI